MIAHIRKETGKEQTVEEHLLGTAEIAKKIGQEVGIESLAELTALVHDMGKMRKRFEEYLRAAVAESGKTWRGEVNHSSAGAIFLEERYNSGDKYSRLTAQLMAVAVFSHHGFNDCISPEGKNCYRERIERRSELDYEEVIQNFRHSSVTEARLDELFSGARKEVQNILERAEACRINKCFMIGVLERMLLSVLIDADRLDTAVFCGDRTKEDVFAREKQQICSPELWNELSENVEKYIKELEGRKSANEEIAALRRQISKECAEFSEHPSGIYRLSVPTGGGKTVSSLRYALNHAGQYQKKRIFYIGPYLSILDQNSTVFQEALGNKEVVLVHHSNVIREKTEENSKDEPREEGQPEDDYRRFTENWEHPMVVTTFVQFLNTLFSASTQSVRRFHQLADSVILIDEIQSLPTRMIALFHQMINILHEIFGATVILCSATQPILEKAEFPLHFGNPPEMMSDVPMLYRKLKRVRTEIIKEVWEARQTAEFLMRLLEDRRSVLTILNTKTSARKVYQELKTLVQEQNEGKPPEMQIALFHLSTNMCPKNRLEKLEEMKELLSNKEAAQHKGKVLCVSTALIEAGVDISFGTVVRARTGLDSIAQAAGRCNRNGEAKEGVVYLIRDKEEYLGSLQEISYSAECAAPVLDDFSEDPEKYGMDLLSPSALEKYYAKKYNPASEDIKHKMRYPVSKYGTDMVDLLTQNESGKTAYREKMGRDPENMLLRQAFQSAGKEFEVIEQNTTGVLVPYGKGRELIADLSGDTFGKDKKALLKQAQLYTVNLYAQQIKELNRRGGLSSVCDGSILVLKEGFYKEDLGICTEGNMEFLEV
ncbi:MAG: CRISPR-associated helicase Cas3' [Lachnospiraceae bacterium]